MTYTTKLGQDAYDNGSPIYYILQVLMVMYAAGYIASLVLIQNANVVHTFHKANINGVLYSNRFNSLYWFALMFSALRIFVIIFVCLSILFRKTTCCKCTYSFCSSMWLFLLVVVIAMDFLVLSILSNHYSKCNGLDQLDNPCNDKKWCCASEIYSNPANLCGNTCAAFIPYSSLVADVDFIWLFSVTVAFCAFDLAFLFIPVGLWLYGGGVENGSVVGDDVLAESDVQYKMPPTPPPPQAAGAQIAPILSAIASSPLLQEQQQQVKPPPLAVGIRQTPKRRIVHEISSKMTKQP